MTYKDVIEFSNLAGTKAKEAFLDAHRDDDYFRKFLYYALNTMLTYNISSKLSKIMLDVSSSNDSSDSIDCTTIFDVCEMLSKERGIRLDTVKSIGVFLRQFDIEERELYAQLLSKSVRLGVTSTTVNKCIPGLIPTWDIQQALTIENCDNWKGKNFWLTQKLNGVRATYYKGALRSRSGESYNSLDHITAQLDKYPEYVFDGELTLLDKGTLTDNEAFRMSTGIINSINADKSNIMYTIFDVVPVDEFDGMLSTTYSNRRVILDSLRFDDPRTVVLKTLYYGDDSVKMFELLDRMVAEDKEGLMLNLDVPYQRKRHNGILKVKKFYTMDLPVIGVEEGSGRLKGTTGALQVDFKGNIVRVGSGLSDENRHEFWNHPNDIVGKLIEVKYKEISSDKTTGKQSLQFPIFIRIRDDKDVVSYS